jgi:hypothetical protein
MIGIAPRRVHQTGGVLGNHPDAVAPTWRPRMQSAGRSHDNLGMPTIRARCPACGEIELDSKAVSLRLHPSGDRGTYRYTCPDCFVEVDAPASRRAVALLRAAGVRPASGREDAWPSSPPLPFDDWSPDALAAPFSLDDVIAFHFLLESAEPITELILRV